MSVIHSRDTLINDFYEFLNINSSFDKSEINIIIQLLKDYSQSNNKQIDKKIFSNLEKIVFKDIPIQAKYSLEKILNKHANSGIYSDIKLKSRHIWILRSVLSRLKLFKRQSKFDNKYISEINKNGIILIPNFLDSKDIAFIEKESKREPFALNKGNTKTIMHSNKIFSKINFYPRRLKYSSKLLEKISDFIYPLGYSNSYSINKNNINRSSFWQKINIIQQEKDIQKDYHMDTFFPSLKFWYFPFKVNKLLAFNYAKSSHLLSLDRMILESNKINALNFSKSHDNSIKDNDVSSLKSELEGSLRFSKKDLDKLNLEMSPHDVERNTLVVADVSGLHSRAQGSNIRDKSLRVAIHGNIRNLNNF